MTALVGSCAMNNEDAPAVVDLDEFTGAVKASADPWAAMAHTLGATANYILVGVSWEANVAMEGVTAGGVAMNALTRRSATSGLTNVQWFWLDDSGSFPTAGSIDIVVNPASATPGYVGAYSLINAAAGAPNRTDPAVAASAGSVTAELAGVPAGAFVASCSNGNGSGPMGLTGEEVEDFINATAAGGQSCAYGHNLPETESTITHVHDEPNNDRHAAEMVEILPA